MSCKCNSLIIAVSILLSLHPVAHCASIEGDSTKESTGAVKSWLNQNQQPTRVIMGSILIVTIPATPAIPFMPTDSRVYATRTPIYVPTGGMPITTCLFTLKHGGPLLLNNSTCNNSSTPGTHDQDERETDI